MGTGSACICMCVLAQVRGSHTTLPCGAAAGSLGLEESGLLSPASLALVGVKRVHILLSPRSSKSGLRFPVPYKA